ncbi:small multidrug resistance protein [Nostoc sp. 'Peltigera membranacea cyanobiont' 213]|uniref:EamA family transporter n=1 Tax=unclassified Nostoc TaxID=2593658 RepID=UPI000B9551DC|nr:MULTISPECIES: EamA family transporter [unclassified Nostoc]OYD97202.1 small multidrug resistance protein [Nostoc sp. 'Peltigera membranacea cyanobiont' 213]OYE05731.1 small multidrug resistance protein [Nostoc sp. 'Peltigera membranacea cyanobiont' 232]
MKSMSQISNFKIIPYFILFVSILFSISGQLLMKNTMSHAEEGLFTWEFIQKLVLAVSVYCLGVVNWILALRSVKLSVAYPLTSLNYVGILFGSYYFFNEVITLTRIAGVITIFMGVLLVVLPVKKSI